MYKHRKGLLPAQIHHCRDASGAAESPALLPAAETVFILSHALGCCLFFLSLSRLSMPGSTALSLVFPVQGSEPSAWPYSALSPQTPPGWSVLPVSGSPHVLLILLVYRTKDDYQCPNHNMECFLYSVKYFLSNVAWCLSEAAAVKSKLKLGEWKRAPGNQSSLLLAHYLLRPP